MTRDEIQAEFDAFIEYPGKDKTYVTTVSTLLFAEHIAKMAQQAERERCAKVCERMDYEDGPDDYAWAIRTEWAADAEQQEST